MTATSFVRIARLTLTLGLAPAAAALILLTHASQSGYYHRPSQYLLISSIRIGSVVVPMLVVADFMYNSIRSTLAVRRGQARWAMKCILTTLLIDTSLLIYAFAIRMAAFTWAG